MVRLLLIGILVTEILKYGIWFLKIKGMKLKHISEEKRAYIIVGCIVGVYLLLISVGAINEKPAPIPWNIATVIIIYGLLLESAGEEKGLSILQSYIIIACFDEIISYSMDFIVSIEDYAYVFWKGQWFVSNIIVIILLLGINFIRGKIKKSENRKNRKIVRISVYILVTIMIVAIFLTVSGFYEMAQRMNIPPLHTFALILTIISFICIACIGAVISYVYDENKRNWVLLEKEAQLVEMQRNQYEAMVFKNEETRRFRHDIQNHLICLRELAKHEEFEKVQNYIDSMAGNVWTIQERVYNVGNSVIDAVLNYYLPMLSEHVKVKIEGFCASNIPMSEMEFCTVISNLVQNAVEALNKSENETGYLTIKFEKRETSVRISIINSIAEGEVVLEEKNNLPITTKKNKKEHGIGLHNAKEVVERNGGLFMTAVEGKEFIVMIEINN